VSNNIDGQISALKHQLKKTQKPHKEGGYFSAKNTALDVLSSCVGGGFFGFLLDKFFSTTPILTCICLALGFASWFYGLYKKL